MCPPHVFKASELVEGLGRTPSFLLIPIFGIGTICSLISTIFEYQLKVFILYSISENKGMILFSGA